MLAYKLKTVKCGLSWTSSWALLTATALDSQRLEGARELSLSTTRNSYVVIPIFTLKLGAGDLQLEHEMLAAAKIGWKNAWNQPRICRRAG